MFQTGCFIMRMYKYISNIERSDVKLDHTFVRFEKIQESNYEYIHLRITRIDRIEIKILSPK